MKKYQSPVFMTDFHFYMNKSGNMDSVNTDIQNLNKSQQSNTYGISSVANYDSSGSLNFNHQKIYEEDFSKKLNRSGKNTRRNKRFKRKTLTLGIAGVMVVVFSFGAIGMNYFINPLLGNRYDPAVLGATTTDSEVDDIKYRTWIESQNNSVFSEKTEDLDKDSLTNYEEFLLDTKPFSANTCSENKTDIENLLSLIDPKSCESIDLENEQEFAKFSTIMNLDSIKEKFLSEPENEVKTDVKNTELKDLSLVEIFGVKSLNDFTNLSVDDINKDLKLKESKLKYLKTIEKIEQYISKYRSYDIYDRDYETPVHAAKYLDVSLKYGIPVKYLLAIARAESRFGTDRYTNTGNLTRPGAHSNIFSLGLTDSGSNFTFNSWESGVDSMGKWWQKYDQKGVSIERRLKIFNPNGDYPGKINDLADQIEVFLNS